MRFNLTTSTLVPSILRSQTPRDYFLDHVGVDSVCLSSIWTGHDIPETVLEQLKDTERPLEEIEEAIGDLESILAGLRVLQHEFRMLANATLDQVPPEETGNEEADAAAYRTWENNPRFILPMTDQKEAA